MDTYKINIAGCDRELMLCPVNDKLDIAAFIMFGDVEITKAAAKELLKKCPKHDIIITAEAKGIPLAYEMAREGCQHYVVARKATKLYMQKHIEVQVRSITTARMQNLYLDQNEAYYMNGKRVLIVDDVISTGESLHAVEELVHAAGGNIVGKAAVLAEGDASKRNDIIFLEPLPLFFK